MLLPDKKQISTECDLLPTPRPSRSLQYLPVGGYAHKPSGTLQLSERSAARELSIHFHASVCGKNVTLDRTTLLVKVSLSHSKTEHPKREVLGQGLRGKAKALQEAHKKGRREIPCRLTPGAAGACFGRREETQITEVASQKGNLQNGGFLKVRP